MANFLEGYEAIKVLGARVVIELEEESDKTESGLILVQDHKEPKFEGRVVSTGDGARLENGNTMPMDVQPGDRVIYSRMAGVPIEHDGKKFLVINERDIIAVINS
jgi:chaperonin GroES